VQFYLTRGDEPPPIILIPINVGFSLSSLQHWLNQHFSRKIELFIPQRGSRKLLITMAEKNAYLFLKQRVIPDDAQDLADLKEVLQLPRLPETIEAFDISNIGTSFPVAGMVQFKGGRPNKSAYRHYKIKSVEGQNDLAMMMEVVSRRLKRLADEQKPFPDLLLIDGGPGQLSAAVKSLEQFENRPFIVSLAKKEETLFSPHLSHSVQLPQTHPARKFVERIRDEVHRYSVSYHRKLRGKQYSTSELEKIEGIGKKRAVALLKKFGSLKRIMEAPVDELIQVSGINKNMALQLKNDQVINNL
jgi:excinuclease ABC subunit C